MQIVKNNPLLVFAFLLISLNLNADGDLIYSDSFDSIYELWSDPETWGGVLPVENDIVNIPIDKNIILDISPPNLNGIEINGALIFDRKNLSLTTNYILLSGTLRIGSPGQPFSHTAEITLTGNEAVQNIFGMGNRGLYVQGGKLLLYGAQKLPAWTKINQHLNIGDTELLLGEEVLWGNGDQLVIAPTDFFGISQTNENTLFSFNGTTLELTNPSNSFHWGLIQYMTPTGISLSQSSGMNPPSDSGYTPLSLDERAAIGNLTRNIIIQGADDELWQNTGYGAHLIIMQLSSFVQVESVEFRRVGQSGRMGRYPVHWHGLSYDALGSELGDVDNHYIKNSSIHNSSNRCVTIHGTNGLLIENNICYDILGHAIFFEDAVERRNLVLNNLVLKVRNPSVSNALKLHDTNAQGNVPAGSSGLWVTNPDNIVNNNHVADSQGFGIWMAFPDSPLGVHQSVPIIPNMLTFGNFDNNTSHSNGLRGVMFDNPEIDSLGNVGSLQYASTTDGQPISWPYDTLLRFSITGLNLWKNNTGNFWDRATLPDFSEFVSADSSGKFFAGSGALGVINRSLIIGNSLNNFSDRPAPWMGPPTALATYHSAFDMQDNIIAHFDFFENKTSGAFATDDYYRRAVDKGQIRNSNNMLIDSHPGYRSDAKIDEEIAFNFAQGVTHYVFSSALWDPHGTWGEPGNWSVYDIPFLTHGSTCEIIQPVSQRAVSCDGAFFGIDRFILNQSNAPTEDLMAINVTRFDETNTSEVIDTWSINTPQPGQSLGQMRHFAVKNDGIYLLDFPDSELPVDVALSIENMMNDEDSFTLGIRYSGEEDAQVFTTTYDYVHYITDEHAGSGSWANKHDYLEIVEGSREIIINSNEEVYWQDVENGIVWIKVKMNGIEQINSSENEYSDLNLYKNIHLRIWSN